jgi:hypothetical protein
MCGSSTSHPDSRISLMNQSCPMPERRLQSCRTFMTLTDQIEEPRRNRANRFAARWLLD